MLLNHLSYQPDLLKQYSDLYGKFWESPSNHASQVNVLLPKNLEIVLSSDSFAFYWIHLCLSDEQSLEKFHHLNWSGHEELKTVLTRTGYALGLVEQSCRSMFEHEIFLKNCFDEYQREFLLCIKDLVKAQNGEFKSAVRLT